MPARLSAFVIWALVAGGLVFWGYRFWVPPVAVPPNVQTVSESTAARGDLSRLLGVAPVAAAVAVAPVPVAESSRFRLLGVLAPKPVSTSEKPSTAGVALIAVDGKPARAFAVGARLDGELVLQSIARRSASIGPAQGAASVVLELPPPQAPATGSLPRAPADGEPARAAMGGLMPSVTPAQPTQMVQPRPQAQPQPQPDDDGDADDEPATAPPRGGAPNPNRR